MRGERVVVAIALVEDPQVGLVGAGVGDIDHGAGFPAGDRSHRVGDQRVECLGVAVKDLELDDECKHLLAFLGAAHRG